MVQVHRQVVDLVKVLGVTVLLVAVAVDPLVSSGMVAFLS